MKLVFFNILSFFFVFGVKAQNGLLESADSYYDGYVYSKAIRNYKKLLAKNENSSELLAKLGNAYYFNTNFEKAESCYRDLIATESMVDPELYFRYVHALKSVGKYEEANTWMLKFSELKPADSRTKIFKEQIDYLLDIKRKSGRYLIEQQQFNTPNNDFGTAFHKNLLVFASGINSDGSSGKKVDDLNGAGFFDLYAIPLNETKDVRGQKAYPLVGEVNTRFHESTATFTKDNTTMYFTRNNYFKGKRGKTTDGKTLLKIYKATNVNGKWVNIQEMPFNNDEYSVAHPALSPDETKLYFASNGPGSMGVSDIFVVDILADNSYSEPRSLGPKINTDGRESFPFITKSNLLFYASNGKQGLGALDIYVADLNSIDKPYFDSFNVGSPINSEKDDFAFVLDEDFNKGFFSSNRPGGKGEDDIYGFVRRKILDVKCESIIKGIAKNAAAFVKLTQSTILLLNDDGIEIQRVVSDDSGKFRFNIDECIEEKEYQLQAIGSDGKASKVSNYLFKNNEQKFSKEITFEFKPKPTIAINLVTKDTVSTASEITDILKFEPIYFDFGNAKIRPRECAKLLKVIYYLRANPAINIVIESHADSRSSEEFNLELSQQRGKATKKYLVNWKIDPARIRYEGYGEKSLSNQCTNDVRCSEYEHRQNRRSDFLFFEK